MSVYTTATTTTRVLKTQPQTASKKQNGTATTPATALKYKAWYLAKFLCRDVDDPDNYERLREHVSRCRGIKTRVRLSKDGWSAGRRRKMLTTKHRGENVKLDCIEDLMQDEKFINVLLCIFEVDLPDGIRFEIVAYKFRSPDEVRSLVELYGQLTGRVDADLPRSVVNGGGGGGSVIVRQPVVGVASSVRQNGTARPGSVTYAMTMPGRPTNGQLAPNHWSTGGRPVAVDGGGQRAFSQRRYMSASVGDLTADGYYGRGVVVRDQNGRVSTEGGRRLNDSFDRRAWASDNGSIIFTDSDTDTSPNVISSSQVNGTGRSYRTSNGGSSGIEETDSGPIRLVYSRPPSDREIIVHQPNYATAPRDRYRSMDTLSFTQVPVRRARSVEPNSRYASSAFGGARSDIYGRSSGVVHPASVIYQPPSLVHPRFKKQYVSKQLTAPPTNGGPVYRAASRSAHGSVYGGRNGGYYER